MGGTRLVVASLCALVGCLPRPEPAQPQQPLPPPPPPQQPYAQPAVAEAQGGVTVTSTDANAPTNAAYYPPPYPQPYPPPQAYPPPAYPAPGVTASSSSRRLHDGEVIADFAVVGTFGALNLLMRQDIDNGNAVGFILLAGMAGGGGVGYLLTQKYEVDAGAARATTLGMALGLANGALLIQPTGWTRGESVLNFLFLGSAAGAAGGFAYGQATRPTSGQSLFIANLTLLGTATAAFGAISGSRDNEYGTWENGALAVGINGGALTGALVAPSLDWSARRSKFVMASTVIGAFVGGMFAGLLTKPDGSRTEQGDIVTGALTAGMWGGFGLGIMMTKDYAPDLKFAQPATATASRTASSHATILPWVGDRGQLGVGAGGTF